MNQDDTTQVSIGGTGGEATADFMAPADEFTAQLLEGRRLAAAGAADPRTGARYVLAPWSRMQYREGDIAKAVGPGNIAEGKAAGVFRLGNRAYTATGAVLSKGEPGSDHTAWTYERVWAIEVRPLAHWPKDAEKPETTDERYHRASRPEMAQRRREGNTYTGIRVRHQGEDLVLGGDKLIIICAPPTDQDRATQPDLFG